MTITLTPIGPPPTEPDKAGQPFELATYTDRDTGERRRIVGQRIEGVARITDEPADGNGRSYVIEDALEESRSALEALVDDYLAKADALGYAPMHGWI